MSLQHLKILRWALVDLGLWWASKPGKSFGVFLVFLVHMLCKNVCLHHGSEDVSVSVCHLMCHQSFNIIVVIIMMMMLWRHFCHVHCPQCQSCLMSHAEVSTNKELLKDLLFCVLLSEQISNSWVGLWGPDIMSLYVFGGADHYWRWRFPELWFSSAGESQRQNDTDGRSKATMQISVGSSQHRLHMCSSFVSKSAGLQLNERAAAARWGK